MKKREALKSTRLLVLTTVIAATLAVALMGLMSKAGLERIGRDEDREVEYGMVMLKGVYQLKSAVTQQSAAVRGYLLTGDRALLLPREQAITEFVTAIESLNGMNPSPADQQVLTEIKSWHAQYRKATEGLVGNGRVDNPPVASLNDTRDILLARIDGFIDKQEADVAALHAEVDRTEQSTQNMLLGIGTAATLLIGMLGAIVIRRVVVPLGDLQAATEDLGSGQLHRRVPVRQPDEFGSLARSFNTMAGQIESLVHQKQIANDELEVQSEELRAQAEELQAQEEELQAQNEEMRSQQDHLEEVNHALHEANKYKDEFLSVVSHELRTPLTSTLGYTEFLEDGLGGPLTPDQERFVRQIKAGLSRVEHLVDDLLEIARLKAGTFSLRLAPADVRGTVIEVVESLRPQAEDAQLTLETHFEEIPETITMDPERIGQVLTNLLGNAIKFTPAGGVIRVTVQTSDTRLMCQVEDSGRGISPEDMSRLFQRFTQLEQGLLKGGTGLGLSISKALIEAHGGQIGVRSHPGQGSTFWFTLPTSPSTSNGESNQAPHQTV